MLDFEIFTDKIADSAKRLINKAYVEAKSRDHNQMTPEHILFAIAETERPFFNDVMQNLSLDPQVVLQALETHLSQGNYFGRGIKMSESLRMLLSTALKYAHQHDRRFIDSADLFIALFQDRHNSSVKLFKQFGAEPEQVIEKIQNQLPNRDKPDSQTPSDPRGHR
jgi:ATP-dependent Clp protease ATP-binding subunit ClpC